MLKIVVFNAEIGESILVEHTHKGITSYGLIDCNFNDENHKAHDYLKSKNVKQLSFVALTHPHQDHYKGMMKILDEFKVNEFYSFPFGRFKSSLINNYIKQYKTIVSSTSDKDIQKKALEYMKILIHLRDNFSDGNWIEINGPENKIRPIGFEKVEINVLNPLNKFKGEFFKLIDNNNWDRLEGDEPNKMSLSFSLSYCGNTVLLTGDSTVSNWREHKKSNNSNHDYGGNIVNLPHHGSRIDCTEDVIDYIFKKNADDNKIALISASGKKNHPHQEVLKILDEKGIKPYCTNRAKSCGSSIVDMITNSDLPEHSPEIVRLLNSLSADNKITPCQGDITLSIDESGNYEVLKEFQNPCPYREQDLLAIFG